MKNSKNENKPITIVSDRKYFNANLQETDTITLLELPALNPAVESKTPEQRTPDVTILFKKVQKSYSKIYFLIKYYFV